MARRGLDRSVGDRWTASPEDIDVRRRRLRYRAWHRGIREMDLIMGRFADAESATMSESDLSEFERLIEVPDPDLFRWITGEDATPSNYDTPLLRRLRAFHAHPAPIHE